MMEAFLAEHFNDEKGKIKYDECPMKGLTKGDCFQRFQGMMRDYIEKAQQMPKILHTVSDFLKCKQIFNSFNPCSCNTWQIRESEYSLTKTVLKYIFCHVLISLRGDYKFTGNSLAAVKNVGSPSPNSPKTLGS